LEKAYLPDMFGWLVSVVGGLAGGELVAQLVVVVVVVVVHASRDDRGSGLS
jgi:hypothetical protein